MNLQTREQWLEERRKGIGGSDAAAVLGKNPYMTNVELWKIKTCRIEQEDISEKSYVKYGTLAEAPMRELFTLDFPEYEVLYKPFDLRVHPTHSCLVASLDGELIERDTGRHGLLEIKTTNILQSMQRERWDDRIPDNYFIQVLHCMNVCSFDFIEVYARLKSQWGDELRVTERHYHIEREDVKDDLEYLQEKELEFWEKYVLADVCPPLKLPNI